MKRLRLMLGSVCSIAAFSCSGSGGGSEPEGYVLVDPAARQGGATVEVGDHVATSALPIAVQEGERVTLHSGAGGATEESITVGREEVVYIQGAHPQVSHLKIGTQVAFDELRLSGDEGAAKELASQLGGTVAADGAEWRLQLPSVFAGAALAGVPARLEWTAPVLLDETTGAPSAVATQAAVSAAPPAVAAPATTAATNALPSSASPVAFVAATGCQGVAGQWRGRVYSDRHEAYYDFTLSVKQSAGSALSGSVVAETWTATTDQVEPPSACSGSQHVKVAEVASGAVDAAGNMRFDSQSWRVGSHLCGSRITQYSLDKFEVPLASGATSAHGVVSDDVVWTDGLPFELTRVSCQ